MARHNRARLGRAMLVPARRGKAYPWLGMTGLSRARPELAWLGLARHDLAWPGKARLSAARQERPGKVGRDLACPGQAWRGLAWLTM